MALTGPEIEGLLTRDWRDWHDAWAKDPRNLTPEGLHYDGPGHLEDWYNWWFHSQDAPMKLPHALHIRTAMFLEVASDDDTLEDIVLKRYDTGVDVMGKTH